MRRSPALGIAFLLVAALATGAPGAARAEADAPVREAADAFYAALNAIFKGELAPMEAVWSHERDVTYLGPAGGLRVGWFQVQRSWEAQASLKLGGRVEPGRMKLLVGPEIAVVQNEERGNNTGPDGKSEPVSIRATSVFRKEAGQWKMVSHHTDLLPFLEREVEAEKAP